MAKYRTRVFGHDPISFRSWLLSAATPSAVYKHLGPYAADPLVLQVVDGLWMLTKRWDTGNHTAGGAFRGTTETAVAIFHILHVEYMVATKTIALLFEINPTKVSWYCSRWNYLNGTSRQYRYKERT